MEFISNPQLDLAFEYVRNTNKHVFLTGKAGTGKTWRIWWARLGTHREVICIDSIDRPGVKCQHPFVN